MSSFCGKTGNKTRKVAKPFVTLMHNHKSRGCELLWAMGALEATEMFIPALILTVALSRDLTKCFDDGDYKTYAKCISLSGDAERYFNEGTDNGPWDGPLSIFHLASPGRMAYQMRSILKLSGNPKWFLVVLPGRVWQAWVPGQSFSTRVPPFCPVGW